VTRRSSFTLFVLVKLSYYIIYACYTLCLLNYVIELDSVTRGRRYSLQEPRVGQPSCRVCDAIPHWGNLWFINLCASVGGLPDLDADVGGGNVSAPW